MTDYFVIQYSDGDTHVEQQSYSELIHRLDDKWYGEHPNFLTEIPDNTNTAYWNNGILIVEGNIAVPEAREVISRYILKA